MKEKTVKTFNVVVGLKYHRGTLLGQSHRHSTSQETSVSRCKYLGFSIVRVKLSQTGTLITESVIEELIKKIIPVYPQANKIKIHIPMRIETDISGI